MIMIDTPASHRASKTDTPADLVIEGGLGWAGSTTDRRR